MDNLRSAAKELATEAKPDPEKVASLRFTVERLSELKVLKNEQEQEIRTLFGMEMAELRTLVSQIRTRLDALKAEVPKPTAPVAPPVAPSEKRPSALTAPAAERAPESSESLAKKRAFLTADESLFRTSEGKRSTAFGRDQLALLLGRGDVVASEADFDAMVLRLAGAPLNLGDAKAAEAVRKKFVETVSLRLRTFLELSRKVRMSLDGNGENGGGGLLHILRGEEQVLADRLVRKTVELEARAKAGTEPPMSTNDMIQALQGIGGSLILGPIHTDWRRSDDIVGKEIRTGEKGDVLGWRTSDSSSHLEFRVSPALRIFGFALGINLEGNANFNAREAEIVGKTKEILKAFDDATSPETGLLDASKADAKHTADIAEFNRTVEALAAGMPADRAAAVSKAVRDAYALEFVSKLVHADTGVELKGVGGGLTLLFGILPIRAFLKANFERLQAGVKAGNLNSLASFDAIRTGKKSFAEMGISRKEVPGQGFEYAIDPSKGYDLQNRTDLPIEDGKIRSATPLYFRHAAVVPDDYVPGAKLREILIVSAKPIGADGSELEGADVPKRSEPKGAYEAVSDEAMRNDVATAMKDVTSAHIRENYTGFQKLQRAVADAYRTGKFDEAFKLLPSVKIAERSGTSFKIRHPLADLAKRYADRSPKEKRELLSMVLQETAGDWRVRQFERIKRDQADFSNFSARTGFSGKRSDLKLADIASAWDHGTTFDANLFAKSPKLSALSARDRSEVLSTLKTARDAFSKDLGKLDSIPTRTVTNAIGFVNFHQVILENLGNGKSKTHKRFQDVVPVTGSIKAVDVEPTKFENAAIRAELVARTPDFVLESLRNTVNEQAKSVGAAPVETLDDVRKLLLNNGNKGDGAFRPDIELTSDLAYTRFAKCLNDTYLLQNIRLCVTGPSGRTTCDPEIPEFVPSDLLATTGIPETSVGNFGIGVTTAGKSNDGGNGKSDHPGLGGSTTPGFTPGANMATLPS